MNWFSELIVSPVLAGREAPKASWLIGCFSLTRNRLSLSLGSGSSLSFSVLAFKSWRRARVGAGRELAGAVWQGEVPRVMTGVGVHAAQPRTAPGLSLQLMGKVVPIVNHLAFSLSKHHEASTSNFLICEKCNP